MPEVNVARKGGFALPGATRNETLRRRAKYDLPAAAIKLTFAGLRNSAAKLLPLGDIPRIEIALRRQDGAKLPPTAFTLLEGGHNSGSHDPRRPTVPATPGLGSPVEIGSAYQCNSWVRQASQVPKVAILFWETAPDAFDATINRRSRQDVLTVNLEVPFVGQSGLGIGNGL